MKRLTRSNEKLVAGVLSGISKYVNPELDPVFITPAVRMDCFLPSYAHIGLFWIGAHYSQGRS